MKIYIICGAGVGTSTLLKMNVEQVYRELNLDFKYKVYNTSVSLAKSIKADLIYTFESFESDIKDLSGDKIIIDRLMDLDEIKIKTVNYLEKVGRI